MAWNQPGGSKDKDPWNANNNRPQGGSDLDKFLRGLQDKLSGLFGGKGGGPGAGMATSAIISMFALVVALIWASTGVYKLDQSENAYILRFGKKVRKITEPGLGFHFPYPIETIEKVDIKATRILQVGFRKSEDLGGKQTVDDEALMLTKDENIINIEFLVKYKVVDAELYLFQVRNPEISLRHATESAIRQTIGKNKLDFVFGNRLKIEEDVEKVLKNLLRVYKLGVEIQAVEMQSAKPPEQVKEAFNDAIKARENREQFIEKAKAFKRDLIPRAKGEAARMKNEAQGHKESVIKRAEGERIRFLKVAREYAKAPRVTRKRLYLETMQRVMSKTTKIYIEQRKGGNLLYLPLDKLLPKRKDQQANNTGSDVTNNKPTSSGNSSDGRVPRVDDSRLR